MTIEDLKQESSDISTPLAVLVSTAEIDQQISTARKYPRSIRNFLDESTQMVTLNDRVASECIYSIPRGQGKMIEGPSARFAEVIASSWGNCRAGARVLNEDKKFVTAQGVFHDLERNVAITFEVRRRITDKNGARYNEDMVAVTGNAASSIALRNAVLKGVPKAFWSGIYEEARKTAMGDAKTLSSRRTDAIEFLARFGATEKMICDTLGVKGKEDITLEHLAQLRGMATSIKDGDASVETLFGEQNGNGKSVDDLKTKKEPLPDWPKKITDKETGEEYWQDIRGMAHHPAVHGMTANGTPSVSKSGHFTRRRGCDAKEHARIEEEALAEMNGHQDTQQDNEEQPVGQAEETAQNGAQEARTPTYPEVMHAIQTAKDRDSLFAANELALSFDGPSEQKAELVEALGAVAVKLGINDLPAF